METLDEKAQFLSDNGANDFAKEFGAKLINLAASGFQPSEKQEALLDRLVAETKDPSLRQAPTEVRGEHIGKEGQKLSGLVLTLNDLRPINTSMGESILHKFADPAGNEVVVFNDSNLAEIGEVLTVSGTVTRHKEFRGQRSTTLSRVQISAAAMADEAYGEQPEAEANNDLPF